MNNIILLYVKLFVFLVSFLRDGYACSTFVLKSNHLQVYGRNYDWDLDDALVIVNKRGCIKKSADRPGEKGERAIWTVKYGSVTFNQYGREFPMGGMNEVGLGGGGDGSFRYPLPRARRQALHGVGIAVEAVPS